jgi:ribonuclease HII
MLKPYLHKTLIEAGCDEAGRGCLSGPVFAAAVILPKNFKNKLLDDSKKLSEEVRYRLRPIIEKEAIAFAVAQVSCKEIDNINILNASFLAMHRALDKLKKKPQSLLIDGNRFKKYKNIPHHCIIEGDGIYLSIAAASILAKTYRDDYMDKLHKKFPLYNWKQNKGYATKGHRLAIAQFGPNKHHRMSFTLLSPQLKLNFGVSK